ncbi:hypothetical protein [Ralstonia solanacearum]|uniref:hypothetical protein n=1 Tax=Ralstonia solanacearum TaxID=305 RepID=UPI00168AD31C|nr:hypothetical protein [Ralstonia solanacearum]QNT25956.1 hypothetical protein C2I38_028060 [Ralstonia solanacearum]QNT63538.1 hypothetical protein C2L97_27955 [Ralstonia solanacearum]
MSEQITIRLNLESDGSGELFVEFLINGFSGQSSAWFDLIQLEEQVKNFSEFPLSLDHLPCIRGGYWNEDATEIQQEHVYLSARPRGLTGDVVFVVRLATPVETGMDSALHYSAAAELSTTYQKLSEFAADFIRLIRGEIGEIRLG